jgi:hypothetical protein
MGVAVKLVDLDPHWTRAGKDRHGMGILFVCPVHGEGCHLGVWFRNPLDGGPPYPDSWGGKLWDRTGDTFETLTLRPSIHVHDTDADGNRTGTHWHGFIRNGEIQ